MTRVAIGDLDGVRSRRPHARGRAVALGVALRLVAPSAGAFAAGGGGPSPPQSRPPQPAPPQSQAPRPWEQGSTQEQRDRAHQIFTEGNERFFKREYAQAIELYEQAVAIFDHPRIELALARALIRVGRPADAQPHLVAALRFGAEPLDADEYAEAQDDQRALAKQLGAIVIHCRTDGARLTLDGKDVEPCPGDQRFVVMPGRHQVVGKKVGYLTFSEVSVADAGADASLVVELRKPEVSVVRERRWKPWKPWAIAAGGALVAAVGIPFQWRASVNMDRYRADVAALCPTGCQPGTPQFQRYRDQDLHAIETRAKHENDVAISTWVVGGALVTVGIAGVVLNQEHAVLPGTERLTVAPLVSPNLIGLGVAGEL